MEKYTQRQIAYIVTAICEARQFINRAVAWQNRLEQDPCSSFSGSKEGGAAKRASMDLTRALAELRRSK